MTLTSAPGAPAEDVVPDHTRTRPTRTGRSARLRHPGFSQLRAYWPALDGIRAVAVVAVLLYHAGVAAVPGGLLGVDVFFVLSGFLITGLLLDEQVRTGTIRLRSFWARRIRRLLPALMLLLVSVTAGASLFSGGGAVTKLRDDALAALFYVANWRFAFSGQGYFDHFQAPSPLLHLWSLGVEEQFYVLWPILVLILARKSFRPGRFVGVVTLLLLGGSTALLVALHGAGVNDDRLYYGTDTRALALLTGALLACLLASQRGRHRRPIGSSAPARFALGVIGLLGAAALGGFFGFVDGQDKRLYDGGFLLVALASVAVVACAVLAPRSPLSRLLSLPPLVGIGRISYGLYLWHWPLFLVLDADRTRLHGPELLAARLGATLVVSLISYAVLERPIRLRQWTRPPMWFTLPVTTVATAAAVVVATMPGVLPDRSSSQPTDLAGVAASEEQDQQRQLALAAPRPSPGVKEPVRVLVVGDSIGLTAAAALRRVQGPWKVQLLNGGVAGCGIAPGNRVAGSADVSLPDHRACNQWPGWWKYTVNRYQPDVVLLLSGRWETSDRYLGPSHQHIGDARFDQLLSAAMDQGIRILTADGAKVGLVTSPCVKPRELADGTPDPVSSPPRVARYNQLLADAAARHPDVTQMIDLNALLCPGGKFTANLDGTKIRNVDGVHIDPGAGNVLAPLLLGRARDFVGLPPSPAATATPGTGAPGGPGARPGTGASPGPAPSGG